MTETAALSLPLLAPAQAQKHVTVNEALTRLDALVQVTLASRSLATPPVSVADGIAYGVPGGATADWAGEGGRIAIRAGGGWVFADPQPGWRAWIGDEGGEAIWQGGEWVGGLVSSSPNGAGTAACVLEFDHALTAGSVQDTAGAIPANAIVLGVTGRVTQAITGTLTAWRLGSGGTDDRFGRGLGLAEGSYARGLLSSPTSAYTPEPLTLTPEGGDFAGGTVRLAVHYLALRLPAG